MHTHTELTICTKNWSTCTQTMSGIVFIRNIFSKELMQNPYPTPHYSPIKRAFQTTLKYQQFFRGKHYKERSIKFSIEFSKEKDLELRKHYKERLIKS